MIWSITWVVNLSCCCCIKLCATWVRWGSVSRSSKPKDSKRPISSSSPFCIRSRVSMGLLMRPVWAAREASAQLCASMACKAGLLTNARRTASPCTRGLLKIPCASRARLALWSGVWDNISWPCVKSPACWLVVARVCSKSTLAQPATPSRTAMVSSVFLPRLMVLLQGFSVYRALRLARRSPPWRRPATRLFFRPAHCSRARAPVFGR